MQKVRLEVIGPNLGVVGNPIEFATPLTLNPNHPPGWEAGLNLVVPSIIEVNEAGPHSINIILENGRGWDQPFIVVEGRLGSG
jgi:hypothetical protein